MADLTYTITDGIGLEDPGEIEGTVEAEPIGLTDSGTIDTESDAEPLQLSDSISYSLSAGAIARTVTDPVGLVDGGDANFYQPDRVGLDDAVVVALEITREITDGLGLDDATTQDLGGGIVRTSDDPVGLTDAIAYTLAHGRTITDAVAVADAIVVSGPGLISQIVADVVGATDAIVVTLTPGVVQFPDPDGPRPPVTSSPFDRTPGPPYNSARSMPPGTTTTPYRPGAA